MIHGLVVIAVGAVAGAGALWVRLRGVVASAEHGAPVGASIERMKEGGFTRAAVGVGAGFAEKLFITGPQQTGVTFGADLEWMELALVGGAMGSALATAFAISATQDSTKKPSPRTQPLPPLRWHSSGLLQTRSFPSLPYHIIIPFFTPSPSSQTPSYSGKTGLYATAIMPWALLTALRAPNLQLPSASGSKPGESASSMNTTSRLKLRIVGFPLLP